MWTSFRTQPMALYEIFIHKDCIYNCMNDLADAGIIQFYEGPGITGRRRHEFTNEVRRCAYLEGILSDVMDNFILEEIKPKLCPNFPETPNQYDISNLEAEIKSFSRKISTISSAIQPIRSDYLEMVKLKSVFEYVRFILDEEDDDVDIRDLQLPLVSGELLLVPKDSEEFVGFQIIAGLMPTLKVRACEKTLWRIGQKTIIFRYTQYLPHIRFFEMKDMAPQSMFIMMFQGYRDIKSIAINICLGYGAVLVDIPSTKRQRTYRHFKVEKDIKQTLRTIDKSIGQLREELIKLRPKLCCLTMKVKKMKQLFTTLNEMKTVSKTLYVVECWIPLERVARAKYLVDKNTEKDVPALFNKITTNETPPSLTYANKVTKAFQVLTNAYSIPSYQEMNPTPFIMITFPFLFAIMFGDVGHGAVVICLATWVIIKEDSLKKTVRKNEIFRILFAGRYMILLMGIFSVYVGLMFNSFFSRPINVFGTSWRINYNTSTIMENHYLILDPSGKDYIGTPCWFGQDVVWRAGGPENLPVINSFKMKLSIIFGIVHMIFGICVGICNKIHFKDYPSIWLDSIPQLIFLCALFLYLVILIFHKWAFFGADEKGKYSSACAPLILIMFINMVMFKKPEEPKKGCSKDFYTGQSIIEKFLALVAFLMVPIMMFGMPVYINYKRKQWSKEKFGKNPIALTTREKFLYEENMSDIIVHQLIHTIEAVLGSVSHTASYLRLWALGLAHEQLAEVIWNMILVKTLKMDITYRYGAILLFFTFGVWALLSLAILILMEGLSAFLHTLRLHWIEFQSRFYLGNGNKFIPLSFEEVYRENDDLLVGHLLE